MGRPRKRETRLTRWIDETMGADRAKVASQLGIGRTYLDRLCRAERRPSLELATEIERLSSGYVTAAELAKLPPHARD